MKKILCIMINSILIAIMLTACGKNVKSDFNSKSISLYQMVREQDGNNHVYKFKKIITITDSKTVTDIEHDFSEFNFSKQNQSMNCNLDYYLVFDDTGVVLQFAHTTTDNGRLGTNFNADYKGINGYKESELFSCDLTKYVHIPLNALSVLDEYIKN